MRLKSYLWFLIVIVLISSQMLALANEQISYLYREDFRKIPAATPVTHS